MAGFQEIASHGGAHQAQTEESEFCHKPDCTHMAHGFPAIGFAIASACATLQRGIV